MALILFSVQFIEIISHYKKIDCNINVVQQNGCFTVGNFALLFYCMLVSRTSDPMPVLT